MAHLHDENSEVAADEQCGVALRDARQHLLHAPQLGGRRRKLPPAAGGALLRQRAPEALLQNARSQHLSRFTDPRACTRAQC